MNDMNERKPMALTEIQSVLKQEAERAADVRDNLGSYRSQVDQYYNGAALQGDESLADNRSRVITRDVQDSIGWIMPSLMEIFFGGDETVIFEPTGEEDAEIAQQQTDWVNYVINKQNNGYGVFHDWFQDALKYRLGWVKTYWDDSARITTEEYSNVNQVQLMQMAQRPDMEIISYQPGQVQYLPGPDGIMPAPTFTVRARRIEQGGVIRIENVPPEEVLFSPYSKDVETTGFLAHQREVPYHEMIAAGYTADQIDAAVVHDREDRTTEKAERHTAEGGLSFSDDTSNKAMKLVMVTEAYMWLDPEGDGSAELHQVTALGSNYDIVDIEPIDMHPLTAMCPYPVAHKLVGESLADKTMDIQDIKSTILRQGIDALYINNTPEREVNTQNIDQSYIAQTIEALSNPGPGSTVYSNGNGPVVTQIVKGTDPGPAFAMLDYWDKERESRTGTSRVSQGMDADTLSTGAQTKGGMAMMIGQSAKVQQLIARNFAEGGVRQLFRKVLALSIRHHDAPQQMRLRNQSQQINPADWREIRDMDLTVRVGIGTGEKERRLMGMNWNLGLMMQLRQAQHPSVTDQEIYNLIEDMNAIHGIMNIGRYYKNPASPEVQQAMQQKAKQAQEMQSQDPMKMAAAAEMQKAQNGQAKVMADYEVKRTEAELEAERIATDKAIAEIDAVVKTRELELKEAELRMKAASEDEKNDLARRKGTDETAIKAQIEAFKAQAKADLDVKKAEIDADLKVKAAEQDRALKRQPKTDKPVAAPQPIHITVDAKQPTAKTVKLERDSNGDITGAEVSE